MSTTATNQAPQSFEAALAELEAIVQDMETGKLALEESLSAYQRGAELLKYCQNALSSAERKVQILEGGELGELSGEGGPTT